MREPPAIPESLCLLITINGIKGNILFDSGANKSYATPELAVNTPIELVYIPEFKVEISNGKSK